jgi:excisionase family DNA binding protein
MEKYLTSEQVATFLQVHPFTVLKYLKDGRLPGVKIGRMYRIKESDVEQFLGTQAHVPVATKNKEPKSLEPSNTHPAQGTPEPKIRKTEEKQKIEPTPATHELKIEKEKEEDYYSM